MGILLYLEFGNIGLGYCIVLVEFINAICESKYRNKTLGFNAVILWNVIYRTLKAESNVF